MGHMFAVSFRAPQRMSPKHFVNLALAPPSGGHSPHVCLPAVQTEVINHQDAVVAVINTAALSLL